MEITPKKRTLARGKISHFGKKALYVRRKNYYNVKRNKTKGGRGMERALVCDARYRMSLPVIRSLGRAGIAVDAADLDTTPEARSLGFYSRYTDRRLHLPDPASGAYLDALRAACGTARPAILPVGIHSLLALAAQADAVREFADVALPSPESLALANDKAALTAHARALGVPTPDTTTLREGEAIEALAARIVYPVVIKYRAGELLALDPKDRYAIVRDRAQFCGTFRAMHARQPYPLVQQYIEGPGWGVSAVFDRAHNPLAVFCHRRIREYPVTGGPSSCCVSVWEKSLVEHAVTLLRSLSWTGVAMVEFKGTPETGFALMEINPRFWGSLALAPISGCDIPLALYRAARGELAKEPPEARYRLGQKMHFILQDTLSIPGYLRQSEHKAALLFGYMRDLLNPAVKDGVWSARDLKSSVQYFKQALRKTDKIVR